MRIALHLLGRELLAVDVDHPAAAPAPAGPAREEQHEPAPEAAAPPDHVCAEPARLGFHGGSGGQVEHSWQPDTRRPIDTAHSRQED